MTKLIAIVTGGAGFIGSHAVDILLEQGYHVRAIDNLSGGHLKNIAHHKDNPDFEFVKLDILDLEPGAACFKNASIVIHFAGIGDIVPSIEQPTDYMAVNVLGTVKVLEAARHVGVKKFVYAASSSCYGLADTPTDESHRIGPQYPYALSKYQGECAVFHWHQVYKLPVNVIRIFNAYGTRVRTTGAYGAVFGVFFKQKLAGMPFTVVGDGTQARDFIYVTDVARAFIAAAETEISGEIWNVGANNPQSVSHLVELLGGGDVDYVPKRPGEPDCTWANIAKINRDLGWQPQVSFEDGVSLMVRDIENWRNAPLWDKKTIAEATKTWFECLA
jgi:UDP-glucose 4-epimerase